MNYLENLQILPMGSVRHFRRIREHDARFLKMCVFLSPEFSDFRKKNHDFPEKLLDFPEPIPAYLNFAAAHIVFVYHKKLSCSSRNAYIKKISVRELGEASSLLKNFKNA